MKKIYVVVSYKNGVIVRSKFFKTQEAAEKCVKCEENDFRNREIISLTSYINFLKTKGKSQSEIDHIIADIELDDEYYK